MWARISLRRARKSGSGAGKTCFSNSHLKSSLHVYVQVRSIVRLNNNLEPCKCMRTCRARQDKCTRERAIILSIGVLLILICEQNPRICVRCYRFIGILRIVRCEKIFNSFYAYTHRHTHTIGCGVQRYTSDIEFQQRGRSGGRSIFTRGASETRLFSSHSQLPRFFPLSLPFFPALRSKEMHRDRRSFFRDILDSITENLVTLSTFDRISSSHFSAPQLRRVTGGANDNSRILCSVQQCVLCTYSSFSDRFSSESHKSSSVNSSSTIVERMARWVFDKLHYIISTVVRIN